MRNSTLLNEIISLATSVEVTNEEPTNHHSYFVQTQYMNVLYLIVLHSEPISVQLMQNPQINLLSCISAWLQLVTSSRPITFLQVTFSALQLLYGLCQHGPSTQKLVIDFYTKQKKKSADSLLFQQLRRLTFISMSPLLRYYSLLTWDTFVNGGSFKRFVTKNEQLINVLMFVLKEEQEVVIKRLAVQMIRQLCRTSPIRISGVSQEDSQYELLLLLNHFNLLFEALEILRYYMTFLTSHFEQQRKAPSPNTSTMEDREKYVSDCIQLVISLFFLLATCATENSDARELLLTQYEIHKYIDDLLYILSEEVNDQINYRRVLVTAEAIFDYKSPERVEQQEQLPAPMSSQQQATLSGINNPG